MHRDEVLTRIDEMVAENRDQCLWFWKADYVPTDDRMRRKALDYIQRHGNREAALEAARLDQWLSRNSKDTSVASQPPTGRRRIRGVFPRVNPDPEMF